MPDSTEHTLAPSARKLRWYAVPITLRQHYEAHVEAATAAEAKALVQSGEDRAGMELYETRQDGSASVGQPRRIWEPKR